MFSGVAIGTYLRAREWMRSCAPLSHKSNQSHTLSSQSKNGKSRRSFPAAIDVSAWQLRQSPQAAAVPLLRAGVEPAHPQCEVRTEEAESSSWPHGGSGKVIERSPEASSPLERGRDYACGLSVLTSTLGVEFSVAGDLRNRSANPVNAAVDAKRADLHAKLIVL